MDKISQIFHFSFQKDARAIGYQILILYLCTHRTYTKNFSLALREGVLVSTDTFVWEYFPESIYRDIILVVSQDKGKPAREKMKEEK